MIYLHCGWPKTGTTSLQASLAKHRDRLAASGIVYPDVWHRGDNTHNELTELLRRSPDASRALAEVDALRETIDGRNLLLSAESLTTWMVGSGDAKRFLEFLSELGEMEHVKCVWTLRRFDEVIVSLHLQPRPEALEPSSLAPLMRGLEADHLFDCMHGVEEVAAESVYVKYQPDGRHNIELLRALGVPRELARDIERDLNAGPRLNVARNRADVSVEPRERQDFHQRMLDSARKYDFEPYLAFFDEDALGSGHVEAPPIVQYWHDAEIPADVEELFAAIREHNPDMRHMVFDEESAAALIEEHLGAREASAFRSCAVPAMQADYFRLCAVYILGGIYCDADSRCSGSLAPLLAAEGTLFENGRIPGLITNHIFAFRRPGHPLLRLAIDIATTGIEQRSSESVSFVTGPAVLTQITTTWRLGSFEACVERMGKRLGVGRASLGDQRLWKEWVSAMRPLLGDRSRVADAFAGVRVVPYETVAEIVCTGIAQLAYKQTGVHHTNWEGSIYREVQRG
ncbi:MAG TPA: glycosyltransferase [Solirubrobacterales bacterium]|nr:glycosyltransferase [Solirubrobacterales bacterium]